ncbi:MAG: UDP-N-acetylglucosamine 1-carboxyvinyltransferase [Sphaerochaetaceae bacterium]|nr:UDP-N-acetylglucosamine 1-carboxyvinyltransferase [Sphaerochaetaceae bacterium]
MGRYIVKGGKRLSGEIRISGNKNAALPCIAATLLTDEKVHLDNIPDILDVRVMKHLLEELGSEIDGNNFVSHVHFNGLSENLVDSVRGSILLVGPLLARGEKLVIPPPGGDVIGLRRLDTHFIGLTALGAECVVNKDGYLTISADAPLVGNDIFLDEASVTATENVIMAAVLAEGTSTIYNCACEPHVQDLCKMLVSMGAKIEGIGSNLLTIEGQESLHGTNYTIGSDYMELGSFIGLAAVTGGDILLTNVDTTFLRPIELGFEKLGISLDIKKDSVYVPASQRRIIQKTYLGNTNKLDDAPWPGFPADLLSIMTVTATQMYGSILIHEKMFESRMYFIDYLIRLGADIILCDPHRAVVKGKTILHSGVVTSPDVRAGMALVIAALCADGVSVIENIEQIERGYENLLGKLRSIGAEISENLEDLNSLN